MRNRRPKLAKRTGGTSYLTRSAGTISMAQADTGCANGQYAVSIPTYPHFDPVEEAS